MVRHLVLLLALIALPLAFGCADDTAPVNDEAPPAVDTGAPADPAADTAEPAGTEY